MSSWKRCQLNYKFAQKMTKCPICHAALQKVSQSLVCSQQQCTYVELHPITYINEVVNGQETDKRQISRVSFTTSPQQMTVQDVFLKNCKKQISDCCYLLKFPEILGFFALQIIHQAIQNCKKDDLDRKKDDKNQKKQAQSHKNLSELKPKNCAAYSVYVACYQRQLLLQQLKIAKYFGFTFKAWKQNVQNLTYLFKELVSDLPPIRCPLYLLKKVCRARRIQNLEKTKMLQICQKMQKHLLYLGKEFQAATLAGLSFWKVCQESQLYREQCPLAQICRGHEIVYQDCSSKSLQSIEKFFDATAENIKRVYKVFFEKDFYLKYMIKDKSTSKLSSKNQKARKGKQTLAI